METPVGSTMSFSDVYPNYRRADPQASQPTAAAVSSPTLEAGGANQPAYFWIAMIALLVVARFIWERSE